MTALWLVALSALSAGIMWRTHQRHLRSIADTSDKQFGEYFLTHFGIDAERALVERTEIANIVGVPAKKLAPETTLGRLAFGQFDIGTQVGLTDLGFDLSALAEKAGVKDRIR